MGTCVQTSQQPGDFQRAPGYSVEKKEGNKAVHHG